MFTLFTSKVLQLKSNHNPYVVYMNAEDYNRLFTKRKHIPIIRLKSEDKQNPITCSVIKRSSFIKEDTNTSYYLQEGECVLGNKIRELYADFSNNSNNTKKGEIESLEISNIHCNQLDQVQFIHSNEKIVFQIVALSNKSSELHIRKIKTHLQSYQYTILPWFFSTQFICEDSQYMITLHASQKLEQNHFMFFDNVKIVLKVQKTSHHFPEDYIRQIGKNLHHAMPIDIIQSVKKFLLNERDDNSRKSDIRALGDNTNKPDSNITDVECRYLQWDSHPAIDSNKLLLNLSK